MKKITGWAMLLSILLGPLVSPVRAAVTAGDVRKVMVFTFDISEAKLSTAENLTEKFFLEMTAQHGLKAGYIRNEERIKENRLQHGPLLKTARDCHKVECASHISKTLGYDFAVIGIIKRQGSGYMLGIKIIETQTMSVVFRKKQTFRQGKRAVVTALPAWGAKVASKIAEPSFNVAFSRPESPPARTDTAGAGKGWKSGNFDPATAQLNGTRISGALTRDLTLENSPYIATGNLTVPPGTDLKIEPGVILYIGGEYSSITVLGKILARGTAEKPIRILSGKKKQAPWDWNRILFQSNQRSVLEHVHLSHSNYGIVVQNGAVTLSNSVLSENSVRGMYVENSDVEIRDSRVVNGHLIAIQIGEYGEVLMERCDISDNHNGISISDFGSLMLRQSRLERNERALILMDSVSLVMENSHITGNRIGVVTNNRLSSSMFDGLKGNQQSIEPIRKDKIAALLEKPPAMTPRRTIRKDLKKPEKPAVKKMFARGIKSLKKQVGARVMGNVALGSEMHFPKAAENTTDYNIITGTDTVAPGEEISQDKVIPGYYQTLSAFTTLDMGRTSLDGSIDLKWDKWGRIQMNTLSVKSVIGQSQLGMGDFNESGSEISVSGLSLRGLKYGLDLAENRQGRYRFRLSGVAGEAERSYDEGDRVLNSYRERKTPGSAVPQKLVGLVRLSLLPLPNWDLNLNYVYSDDKRSPILRPDLARTSVATQDPLFSKMLGAESQWRFLKDKVTLTAEINVGTVDSATQAYNMAVDEVLETRGLSESAAGILKAMLQPTATSGFADSNLSVAMVELLPDSNDMKDSLKATGISEKEAETELARIRRSELSSLKSAAEDLEEEKRRELDDSKRMGLRFGETGLAGRLAMNMNLDGMALDAAYTYIGSDYYSGGNPFLVKDQRQYEFSLTRDLTEKLNLRSDYALVVENSSSGGSHLNFFGLGEGSGLGLLPDKDFQKTQEKREIPRPKFTHRWDWDLRYDLSSTIELDFVYGFMLKKEMKNKELENSGDSSLILADAYFDGGGANAAQIIYNGFNYEKDPDKVKKYQDATRDGSPLAKTLNDRELTNSFQLKGKYRFSKVGNVRLGGKWKWKNDFSEYKHTDLLDEFDLNDSTLVKMGFYRDGEEEFWQDYDMSITLKNRTLSNKINGKLGFKTKVKRDEVINSWQVKNNFKWKVIPRKLRLEISGSIKKKITREDEERYYFLDNGVKLFDLARSGYREKFTASDTTHLENFRWEHNENEYDYELKARYSFNSRFYMESLFRQEWHLRPEGLEQEYTDLMGRVEFFYSF